MCHQVYKFLKQLYRDWTQGPLFWLQMVCLVPVCVFNSMVTTPILPHTANYSILLVVCDTVISFTIAVTITRYLLKRKKLND